MKKILYITTLSRTINAFLVPHIQRLLEIGFEVDCACAVDRPVNDSLISNGVKVYDIPFSRNPLDLRNRKAFQRLVQIQKEHQYDIVHVHTPIAALYGRLLKMKFPKLKTIYTAHGFHFYKGAPLLNWLLYYPIERIMARFTDAIITMNDEDYERAKSFQVSETYKVNGVGLNLNQYNVLSYKKDLSRAKLGIDPSDFVIVMIAETNLNKNHQQMIHAISFLSTEYPQVKVLCAGEGPLFETLKNEIVKKHLENTIYMLGYRRDIEELISASDIGMLLSYREGLPRNIMELMAFGKPVVGTNIRGIKDLVIDHETGLLVEVGDYEATAEAIKRFIQEKDLLQSCGQKAFERVQMYEISNVLHQLEEITMSGRVRKVE
ncbi:glycosyltransferase family 4 protein [Bacillus sp. JJ664]